MIGAADGAAVETAREAFAASRARIPAFARETFGLRGALRLHRRAVGLDLLRAPANVALAPLDILRRLVAAALAGLGARGAAGRLRRARLILRTSVAHEVERRVWGDLLGLPAPGESAAAAGPLAAAADPEAALARAARTVADYAAVRAAVAEITAALVLVAAGAAVFGVAAPGAISLGVPTAAWVARDAAVAGFPLGAAAGAIWYGLFPPAAAPALLVGATAALVACGALIAALAGVVADPVQTALGVHRRRLRRLVDAVERDLLGEEAAGGFAAREPYLARLVDLADLGAGALRIFRG